MWYIRNVYWQKQVKDWFFSQVFHPILFCLSYGSLSGLLLLLSSPPALENLISPGTGDARINRYLPVSTLLDKVSDVLPSIWGGLLIFQVWLSHIPVIERKMNHQLKQKCRISKGNIFYLILCCQIKPSQTLERSFPPLFLRPTKPLKSLSLLTARHHAMTTMQRSKLQMSAWQQLFEWLRFRTSDASLKASVSFGRLCCLAEKVHPACGSKLAGAFMM